MRAFLESILGTYTPVTYVHYVYDESYNVVESTAYIPSGLAGVDWTFVFTGLAFLILLYSTLRILGGLLCKIS